MSNWNFRSDLEMRRVAPAPRKAVAGARPQDTDGLRAGGEQRRSAEAYLDHLVHDNTLSRCSGFGTRGTRSSARKGRWNLGCVL